MVYATLQSDTRFIYHGWNLVAELTDSGLTFVLGRTYTWGVDLSGTLAGDGGTGGLLMTQDGTNQYVYAYDGNGNVSAVMNRADGTTVAEYEYGAFGEPLRATGTYAQTNPYRFSTQYVDDETGLSYYGHRYYSPETGRFLGRDSLEEKGGLNLYGFVMNNAVNHFDLLGQFDFTFSDAEENDPWVKAELDADPMFFMWYFGVKYTHVWSPPQFDSDDQMSSTFDCSNTSYTVTDDGMPTGQTMSQGDLMGALGAEHTAIAQQNAANLAASVANGFDTAGKMQQVADSTSASFASGAVASSGAAGVASANASLTADANAVAASADNTWNSVAATDANMVDHIGSVNVDVASTAPANPPPPQTSGNGAGAQASGAATISPDGSTAPVTNTAPGIPAGAIAATPLERAQGIDYTTSDGTVVMQPFTVSESRLGTGSVNADFAAIVGAAHETFDNPVFQQPLTTLGKAAVAEVALVGTVYTGIEVGPTALRTAGSALIRARTVAKTAYGAAMAAAGTPQGQQILLNVRQFVSAAFNGNSGAYPSPRVTYGWVGGKIYNVANRFYHQRGGTVDDGNN